MTQRKKQPAFSNASIIFILASWTTTMGEAYSPLSSMVLQSNSQQVQNGAYLTATQKIVTVNFDSSFATIPSLCLCFEKIQVSYVKNQRMRFYFSPENILTTQFDAKFLVLTDSGIAEVSFSYLAFESTSILDSFFFMGATFADMDGDFVNLFFGSTDYEEINLSAPKTYNPNPPHRLESSPQPLIHCLAFLMGYEIDFDSVITSSPFQYFVRLNCSQNYGESSLTVGAEIRDGMHLERVMASFLTFSQQENQHFSVFYPFVWAFWQDYQQNEGTIDQVFNYVPMNNGTMFFGMTSISFEDAASSLQFSFSTENYLSIVGDSLPRATGSGVFIAGADCSRDFYNPLNGQCSETSGGCFSGDTNLEILDELSGDLVKLPQYELDSEQIIGILNFEENSIFLEEFSQLSNSSNGSHLLPQPINSTEIYIIVEDNSWVLTTSSFFNYQTNEILVSEPLLNNTFFTGIGIPSQQSTAAIFFLLTTDCELYHYSYWNTNEQFSSDVSSLTDLSSSEQCIEISILSVDREVSNSSEITFGSNLQIIMKNGVVEILQVNCTVTLNQTLCTFLSIYSQDLLINPTVEVFTSLASKPKLWTIPDNTEQLIYHPTDRYSDNRQHYIYLISGSPSSLSVFQSPNPKIGQSQSYSYQELPVIVPSSASVYLQGSFQILHNGLIQMSATTDGKILVIVTNVNLLYTAQQSVTGEEFQMQNIIDLNEKLVGDGEYFVDVEISAGGDILLLTDDQGKLYLMRCSLRESAINETQYTIEVVMIEEPEQNNGGSNNNDNSQNKSEEEGFDKITLIIIAVGSSVGGIVFILATIAIIKFLLTPSATQVNPQIPSKSTQGVTRTRVNVIQEQGQLPSSLAEFQESVNTTTRTNPYYSSERGLITSKSRTIIIEDLS